MLKSVWNDEKGFYDIFKLRELLPKEYSITIVGLAAKQMGQLPSGIIGIERTQNVDDLVQLYSSANVLINPTYADTFPTVNLEALACGTPVISYRTGGSPEAISPETGVVVGQGDVAKMAESIRGICDRGKDHYTEACRQRAEEYFDKDKCFKKYVELYEELISQR